MQEVKVALGCPSQSTIHTIGTLQTHTYSTELIEHVSTCEKCRPENHSPDCLPYATIRYSINLMPPRLTAKQAAAIEKCTACWLLLSDDGRKVMNNLYGSKHRL